MKRKKVLLTEPVKTKKSGEVITVQEADGILILNIFRNRKLIKRYCMNAQTGEYEVWDAGTGEWSQETISVAAGGDRCYEDAYTTEKRIRYDPPEGREQIGKILNAEHPQGMRLVEFVERNYNSEKRELKRIRRAERLEALMSRVPSLPAGISKWIRKNVAGGKEFVFWDKASGKYTCTACGKEYGPDALKGRHNETELCPVCGKSVMVKRRTQQVSEWGRLVLMQNMDVEKGICRHFDITMTWDQGGFHVRLSEAVRIMVLRNDKKYWCRIYYNQWPRNMKGQSWEERNPANRATGAAILYPEGIGECLAGTIYREWTGLFIQMAEAGVMANYNAMMANSGSERSMRGVAEYLLKGRFYRLLREMTGEIYYFSGSYSGSLNTYGKTATEVLGLKDMQKVNRLREEDGGRNMLEWLRWSEKEGWKLSQDLMKWADKNKITPADVRNLPMSPQKTMNYITRQQAEQYPKRNMAGVLEQYKDYLDMCRQLGKDMQDEMVFRPRELKRRHDEAVSELNMRKAAEQMQRNREAAERREQELNGKYPEAERILKEIRETYEYTGEEFLVRVPAKLTEIILEGQALHHCAGATERYFDRIQNRETYIFFLRRPEKPDVPYYTLEVEPGGTIRQHRTMYDEETGIETVRKFLRHWQQVVKKRLNDKEKELAKISAVKRQENLEELKRANNTRVLNALLEDFMEAV